ncbi:DUF4436 domain-containing protein [Mycobacterium syngnathidarum]|uniref:DUF4436 domain-containing protein n=1 Tax=Mycobacterium syngnathidarum TaxID=1908205 RepID=A0A1S1JC60_9MYCO|nr:DUF4436 domain-containing protein [Mycobacterium syngnathidarum]OLT95681.1 DUF4436 domain-containing protein [Mycobacterium syngnathidarum]
MALLLSITGSLSVYLVHRNANYSTESGAVDAADRVNVQVWINQIDTTRQTMSVEIVDIEPIGALADSDGSFARDIVLTTSALGDPITVREGQTGTDTPRTFAVNGTVTDYPFDRYHSLMTFGATADGASIPVAVTISSADPFFRNTPAVAPSVADQSDEVSIDLTSTRSTPTLVFAVFVMVLMLGLAAATVTASYYILRWRRGLIFPGCSMMAAILFALIPLRNAVPGNPPIGSVIDFVSFFIAETVIAAALIASVIVGYRVEIANELAETD